MRRSLVLLGLLASASAAVAQISVLSNPPGTTGGAATWGAITGTLSSQTDLNSSLAGKAGLSSNNTFTGTSQTVSGAGPVSLHLNTTGGGDTHLYLDNGGSNYGDINGNSNNGINFLVITGYGYHYYVAGAETLGITGTGLNLVTGKVLSVNGATVIDGSGFLQAASFPALTGDVTTSAGALATTIPAGTVTLAKMANMATSSLIYRKTAGSGVPEVNTLATLKTDLGLTGTNSGDQTITLTGDVTGSGTGSFAATIASAAVTLAKMANLAANSIIGNNTGSAAVPTALTTLPTSVMPALTGDVTNSAGSLATTIANNAVTYAKFQQVAASSLVGNATGSLANATGITLAGGLGFSGSTLTAAGALTPTSVASTGAISGTSIAGTTTILSSGATSGIGYATGAGGAVTQATSRTTTVVNNKACGAITMFSAAGSATWATFTVTDSAVAATDTIIANEKSGTNLYMLAVTSIGSGTFNLSFATTGGTATDAPVINYCVIKGVAS